MKRLLLSILFIAISLSAFPQIKNFTALNGPFGGSIEGIISNSNGVLFCYAGSEIPSIYKSTDAGLSWTQSASGIEEPQIQHIYRHPSSNRLYAMTNQSFYISDNDGASWTQVTSSISTFNPRRIAKSSQFLYIVSYFGTVYRSADNGVNWTQLLTVTGSSTVFDFVIDNNNVLYIATNGNGVFVADEAGNVTAKLPGSLQQSVQVVGNDVWLMGNDGPYKSTDHGVTWVSSKSGITSSGPGVIKVDASNGLYVFQNGKIWKSTNGGTSWTEIPNAPGYFGYGFGTFIISPTTYLLSIDNTGIFKTTNSGSSWGLSSNGINVFNQPYIFAPDPSRLFYTIYANGFFSSTNGGATWTLNKDGDTGITNRFIKGFTKFGSTYYGYGYGIIKSTDGTNWTSVNNSVGTPSVIDALASNNGTTMYTFADRFDGVNGVTLYTSTNGGSTFSSKSVTGLPASSNATTVVRNSNLLLNAAGTVIYIAYNYSDGGTNTTGLYKINTSTGAATQVTTFPGSTQNGVRDIKYLNGKLYVVKSDLFVYVSSDEAATWTQLGKFEGFDNQLRVASDNVLLESGSKIRISKDGGLTWTASDTFVAGVSDLAVSPAGTVYVAPWYLPVHKGNTSVFPPIAPTLLKATGFSHDRVGLQWNDNATNEENYVIEMKKTSASTYDSIGLTTVPLQTGTSYIGNFTVSKLTPQTAYNFRVRATNGSGTSYSNEITVTTLADCSTTSAIPDNRSWTGTTTNQSGIGVKTNNAVSITSLNTKGTYLISSLNVGAAGGVHPESSGSIVENCGNVFLYSSTYDVSNGNGTWNAGTKTLTVKWRTGTNNANSIYREETTVYTLNATDPIPSKPNRPSVYTKTSTTTQTTWRAVGFVTQYIVQRSLSSSSGFVEIGRTAYNTLTYQDTGLTPNTAYYYRIIALNATGQSSPSDPTAVTTSEPTFERIEVAPASVIATALTGSAWADLDGDSFEDLIITPYASGEVMIFRNKGNKTFEQVTPVGVTTATSSGSIAAADYNNDGKVDLLLNQGNNGILWTNKGSFTFEAKTISSLHFECPSFVDINKDGLLDIVFAQGDYAPPQIYKQNSDNTFTKHIDDAVNAITFFNYAVSAADYDNDGDTDLYVEAIEGGAAASRLLKGDGTGKFELSTNPAFSVAPLPQAESSSWGDYDNDGDLDLFQGSLNISDILYRNNLNINQPFERISNSITESFSANSIQATNGSAWGDIDNDGDLDLLVTRIPNNTLYLNNGNGTFSKHNISESIISVQGYDNSAAFADIDKDGFLDIYIQRQLNEPITVFRNKRTTGNWIEFKLVGTLSNATAIGARVTITLAGNKKQIREVMPTTGFYSQNSYVVHFGLGTETTIPAVTVLWPSGIEQTFQGVNANQLMTITEQIPSPDLSTPTAAATLAKGFGTTKFSIKVQNKIGTITSGSLMSRPISGDAFTETTGTFNATNNTYEFDVPESKFDQQGVEYYFKAKNSYNKEGRFPQSGNLTTYLTFTGADTRIPSSVLGFGGAITNWKVFTIPYELGANKDVSIVLDEIKAKDNRKDWRLITYKDTENWGEYPGDFTGFDRGKGYFVNIKDEIVISIADNLTAPPGTRTSLFQMNLKKGWNQIGNPYLSPINWTNVTAYNSLTGTAATLKKFAAGSYSNGDQLSAFEGGFVFLDADKTISIPFAGQSAPGRLKGDDFNDGQNWKVDLNIVQNEISTSFSGFGMHKDASESMDEFDDVNPPRFMDYTEINFAHPEHFAKRFALDIVGIQSSRVWTFTVDTNSGDDVKLTWNNKLFAGSDRQMYLFDVNTQAIVDMREENAYSFSPATSSTFKIYYGDKPGAVQLPDARLLRDPSPNPARDKATIQFLLPEMPVDYSVTLDVYDLLGRKVSTLDKGSLKPGLHSREWNASEQADGTYIVRLVVNGKSETRKLMIRK